MLLGIKQRAKRLEQRPADGARNAKVAERHAGLEILSFDRRLKSLATVPVGRGSFSRRRDRGLLVNFVMDREAPFFRNCRGQAVRAQGQDVVAFEATKMTRESGPYERPVNGRAHAVTRTRKSSAWASWA